MIILTTFCYLKPQSLHTQYISNLSHHQHLTSILPKLVDPLSQTWNLRVISFSIHSQATTKPYFTFSQYLPNTTLAQVYFTTGFDDLNRLPTPYQLHSILQTNPLNSLSKKFWCPLNPSLNPRIKFKSFQMTLKGKKKNKKTSLYSPSTKNLIWGRGQHVTTSFCISTHN